jgi:DNA-binding winged helix-turn-helix (wHTH) protein
MLYLFDNYEFDTGQRELRRRDGSLIPVQPQVFDLLEYLIRHRERMVSKDEIMGAIWGGRIVSESALSARINAARTAIGDNGGDQRLIQTLIRRGLRFVGTGAKPAGSLRARGKTGPRRCQNPRTPLWSSRPLANAVS